MLHEITLTHRYIFILLYMGVGMLDIYKQLTRNIFEWPIHKSLEGSKQEKNQWTEGTLKKECSLQSVAGRSKKNGNC